MPSPTDLESDSESELKSGGEFLHCEECVMKRNSHRATERRPRRKKVFLEALVDIVHETLACRRAGIVRRTAYDWREAAARGENVSDSESDPDSDTSDGAGGGLQS